MDVIRFYSVGDAYGELSNFALYPITLRGKRWPTSEHYFQAQKFSAPRDREDVRAANTPMLAARIGRGAGGSGRRTDAGGRRSDVMFGPEREDERVSSGSRPGRRTKDARVDPLAEA